jgi:hypothetical protein
MQSMTDAQIAGDTNDRSRIGLIATVCSQHLCTGISFRTEFRIFYLDARAN